MKNVFFSLLAVLVTSQTTFSFPMRIKKNIKEPIIELSQQDFDNYTDFEYIQDENYKENCKLDNFQVFIYL